MHEEGENLVSSRFHRADLGRLGGTNRNVDPSTVCFPSKTGMKLSHDFQMSTRAGWYFPSSSQLSGALLFMFAISFTGDQWFLFVWLLVLILILGIKKKRYQEDTRPVLTPTPPISLPPTACGWLLRSCHLGIPKTVN